MNNTIDFRNSGSGKGGRNRQSGGSGRGNRLGGGRGLGHQGECVCTQCGISIPHKRGVSCNEMQCPECGAQMTRKA